MYTGVTVAEQLEFDSWPEEQKKLAKKIFGPNETLYALRYSYPIEALPPQESTLPPT